jgi:lysophospholipase L1-like esterase
MDMRNTTPSYAVWWTGVLLLGAVSAVLLLLTHSRVFGGATDWIDAPMLHHEVIRPVAIHEPITNINYNGNQDCTENTKIITRPRRTLLMQEEQSYTDCIVHTRLGAVTSKHDLLRTGTSVAGPVKDYLGNTLKIIGVPKSSSVIHYTTSGSNTYLHLINPDSSAGWLSTTASLDGKVSHTARGELRSLRDANNTLMNVRLESISFSSDGEWMVLDIIGLGVSRVHTKTFEIKPFGPYFRYNLGYNPSPRIAISNSGRWASVYSHATNTFRMYDLSKCSNTPVVNGTRADCLSRDLRQYFIEALPNYTGAEVFRFRRDLVLTMYVGYQQNGEQKKDYIQLSPDDTLFGFGYGYIALGDSYASGEGAFQYKTGTDTPENTCHLSLVSYPYLLASWLDIDAHESVACSGAVMDDISSHDYSKPQSKGKESEIFTNEIINNFLPGYRVQNIFLERYQPEIITISISGNDIGFGDKMKTCVGPGTCFATATSRVEIVQEINRQFDPLVQTYLQTKKEAHEQSKIYALGYPHIAKPSGSCGNNVWLDSDEIQLSEDIISYFNQVIQAAADKAGVVYVDIQDAFYGHRLCETDEYFIAMNGITAGRQDIKLGPATVPVPIASESFHPNHIGHELFAKAIRSNTNNFTKPMPSPNIHASIPVEKSEQLIMNAPDQNIDSNYQPRMLFFDEYITDDVIFLGDKIRITTTRESYLLKESTSYEIWLYSDPLLLAEVTTDQYGAINEEIQLPETAELGLHTVKIKGKDAADTPSVIYKTVYVGFSEEDYDGDGIPNEQDPCPFFEDDKSALCTSPIGGISPVEDEPSEENHTQTSSPSNQPNKKASGVSMPNDNTPIQTANMSGGESLAPNAQQRATTVDSQLIAGVNDDQENDIAKERGAAVQNGQVAAVQQTGPHSQTGTPGGLLRWWAAGLFLILGVVIVAAIQRYRSKARY